MLMKTKRLVVYRRLPAVVLLFAATALGLGAEGEVPRRLTPESAAASDASHIALDEEAFRWMHNEDAMATDKLAEGIRLFDADAKKLKAAIAKLMS